MYKISIEKECLLVQFNANFDYSTIKQVMYKEMTLPDFPRKNDLWLIGEHRADLRLGDIQKLVDDFSRLYPRNMGAKKTAIVVQAGLTAAILELLAKGMESRFPISCRIFASRKAAEEWLGASSRKIA